MRGEAPLTDRPAEHRSRFGYRLPETTDPLLFVARDHRIAAQSVEFGLEGHSADHAMEVVGVARWGGPAQQQQRSWYMAVPPPTALAELRAGVAAVGGRVVAESGRSITARFGSNLAWRLFGPVWPAGRRRSPAVVTMAIDPEPGGSLITAQARIGVNNFFNAKITSDLYNDRLSSLLAALEPSVPAPRD